MLRYNILHFTKFFYPALIEESIMYEQVVSYKTTNLATVYEARLVCDMICY